MSIAQRPTKDGRTSAPQVLMDTRDPVSGKRKRVTAGTFRTKKEAEKAERDAITQHERDTLLDPSKTTVGELLDAWLASKTEEISARSIVDYEIIIQKHLKSVLRAGGARWGIFRFLARGNPPRATSGHRVA